MGITEKWLVLENLLGQLSIAFSYNYYLIHGLKNINFSKGISEGVLAADLIL